MNHPQIQRRRDRIQRVKQMLTADPDRPDESMADELGVHKLTVLGYRMELGLRRVAPRSNTRGDKVPHVTSKPAPDVDTRARRKCLGCGKRFMSDGPGNRVCSQCKHTSAWRDGNDYSGHDIPYQRGGRVKTRAGT